MRISTFQENIIKMRRIERLIDRLWIELRLIHTRMNNIYNDPQELGLENNFLLKTLKDKHKEIIKRIRYLTNYFTMLSDQSNSPIL